jgi:hypothetical protein
MISGIGRKPPNNRFPTITEQNGRNRKHRELSNYETGKRRRVQHLMKQWNLNGSKNEAATHFYLGREQLGGRPSSIKLAGYGPNPSERGNT